MRSGIRILKWNKVYSYIIENLMEMIPNITNLPKYRLKVSDVKVFGYHNKIINNSVIINHKGKNDNN